MSDQRSSRPVVSRLLSVLLGPLLPWFRLLGLAARQGENASENHYWGNVD